MRRTLSTVAAYARSNEAFTILQLTWCALYCVKLILYEDPIMSGRTRKTGPRYCVTKQAKQPRASNMKTVAAAVHTADSHAHVVSIHEPYFQALPLVERLHHGLLEVIKDEFNRRGHVDINPTQAWLIYNIADKELSVGELRARGYYLGTNVSHSVKKLTEIGLIEYQRSHAD